MSARLQTIICSSDIPRAGRFYGGTLGLPLKSEAMGALIYLVGASELRISPVPRAKRSEHTVIGFEVDDIDAVVGELEKRLVTPELFPRFDHDARGIWTAPDATKVFWFRDPDENLLSVVQYGR